MLSSSCGEHQIIWDRLKNQTYPFYQEQITRVRRIWLWQQSNLQLRQVRTWLQLVTSPIWSKCPYQQHGSGRKIWGAKEHLHSTSILPASKKNCCSFPRPLVWHFSVLTGDLRRSNITSLFTPTIELNFLLPYPFRSHSWPEVNPAFSLTHTLNQLPKTPQVPNGTLAICR